MPLCIYSHPNPPLASSNKKELQLSNFLIIRLATFLFLLSFLEVHKYNSKFYLSSILSLLIATMLSFLDDIFDIRWRHKVSSHPYLLLMVYYAEHGKTNVVVPLPLRFMFGTVIDFGTFYLMCHEAFHFELPTLQDHCTTSTCPYYPHSQQTALISSLG